MSKLEKRVTQNWNRLVSLFWTDGPAGMMIVFVSMFCGYKIFSSIVKGFVRRANDNERAKWQKHHDHYEQELQLIIDKYGDWITKILPTEYAYASCANKLLAYTLNSDHDIIGVEDKLVKRICGCNTRCGYICRQKNRGYKTGGYWWKEKRKGYRN